MKSLSWDYTSLAQTYGRRPPYAEDVIDELVAIASRIPDYDYGARRRDPSPDLAASGRFHAPRAIEGTVQHEVDADEWVEAWTSHATLARQAGDQFERIVDEIGTLVARAQVGH